MERHALQRMDSTATQQCNETHAASGRFSIRCPEHVIDRILDPLQHLVNQVEIRYQSLYIANQYRNIFGTKR